jgi:hypothetical protein
MLLAATAALLGASVAGAASVERKRTREAAAQSAQTGVRVSAATPDVASFEAYRGIGERNIFNPNRIGRTTRPVEEAPPRTDVVSFVGTMQYEKGLFAFFDSPDATYRKTLHEGDTLGQFTVQNITPSGVDLVRDAKTTSLAMGQQLRRPEGGEWSVIGADVVRSNAAAAASAATAAAIPVIPADASDALKRLMEKRLNQLKQ